MSLCCLCVVFYCGFWLFGVLLFFLCLVIVLGLVMEVKCMSFFQEFKEFAMRGNVMDMAVGVIIGGAFGKITASAVNDLVMPVVGLLTGGVDFTNLFISLNGKEFATLEAAKKAGAPVVAYGSFINVVVDFLLIAFSVFLMIKMVNRLHPTEAAKPARVCPYCKQEIAEDAERCPHCTSLLYEPVAFDK